jgi:hypothetical protein
VAAHAALVVEHLDGVALERLVTHRVVDEDEDLFLALAVEQGDDALLLHEPQREVEVGLVVLGAVLAGRVGTVEGRADLALVVGELLADDRVEDLGNGHTLEDARVAALAEERERRDDRQVDGEVVARRVALEHLGDDAGAPLLPTTALDEDRRVRAQEPRRLGIHLLGAKLEPSLIGPAQRLGELEAIDRPGDVGELVGLEVDLGLLCVRCVACTGDRVENPLQGPRRRGVSASERGRSAGGPRGVTPREGCLDRCLSDLRGGADDLRDDLASWNVGERRGEGRGPGARRGADRVLGGAGPAALEGTRGNRARDTDHGADGLAAWDLRDRALNRRCRGRGGGFDEAGGRARRDPLRGLGPGVTDRGVRDCALGL